MDDQEITAVNNQIELQALVMIAKGYEAQNQLSLSKYDGWIPYGSSAFEGLASDMRQLKMATEREQDEAVHGHVELAGKPIITTPEIHQAIHQRLHQALDELVADFISQTERRPSGTSVLSLMQWSAEQMQHPTDPKDGTHG